MVPSEVRLNEHLKLLSIPVQLHQALPDLPILRPHPRSKAHEHLISNDHSSRIFELLVHEPPRLPRHNRKTLNGHGLLLDLPDHSPTLLITSQLPLYPLGTILELPRKQLKLPPHSRQAWIEVARPIPIRKSEDTTLPLGLFKETRVGTLLQSLISLRHLLTSHQDILKQPISAPQQHRLRKQLLNLTELHRVLLASDNEVTLSRHLHALQPSYPIKRCAAHKQRSAAL